MNISQLNRKSATKAEATIDGIQFTNISRNTGTSRTALSTKDYNVWAINDITAADATEEWSPVVQAVDIDWNAGQVPAAALIDGAPTTINSTGDLLNLINLICRALGTSLGVSLALTSNSSQS